MGNQQKTSRNLSRMYDEDIALCERTHRVEPLVFFRILFISRFLSPLVRETTHDSLTSTCIERDVN